MDDVVVVATRVLRSYGSADYASRWEAGGDTRDKRLWIGQVDC